MRNAMKAIIGATTIVCTVFLAAGCGSSTAPEDIQSVTVWFHNPFPPAAEQEEQSFTLSADELRDFKQLCPNLSRTKGPGCDSVAPSFWFEVSYVDGDIVRGQCCCKSLRTFDPDGNIDAPGLEDFLVERIKSRAGTLDWGEALKDSGNPSYGRRTGE